MCAFQYSTELPVLLSYISVMTVVMCFTSAHKIIHCTFVNVYQLHILYNLFTLFMYLSILSLVGFVIGYLMHGLFICLILSCIFVTLREEQVFVHICVFVTCSTSCCL